MTRSLIALSLTAPAFPGVAQERLLAREGAGRIVAPPDLVRIDITVSKPDKRDIAGAKAVVDELSSKAAAALCTNSPGRA